MGASKVPRTESWAAAALLLISCVAIASVAKLPPIAGNRDLHPLLQIKEGFSFVWHERFLLGCVTLDLFAVLLGGATALLPVFAREGDTVDVLAHNMRPGALKRAGLDYEACKAINPKLIHAGIIGFGSIALNGNLALGANPLMASGLIRMGEAANRITAGEADRAVAHATSGPCLQQNLVCVLEGEDRKSVV